MRIEVIEGGHPNGADLVVMGKEARINPRAIAASQPFETRNVYGFQLKTVVEVNKEKMAEVVAIIDAARERGEDPRFATPALDPEKNPEWFDLVIYNVPMMGRPSALALRQDKIAMGFYRHSEHLRIPLVEVNQRASEALAANEARGESH